MWQTTERSGKRARSRLAETIESELSKRRLPSVAQLSAIYRRHLKKW